MTKPLVFNYTKYEQLLDAYKKLQMSFTRVKDENTNLQIRCRIQADDINRLNERIVDLEMQLGYDGIDRGHGVYEGYKAGATGCQKEQPTR